MQAAIEALQKGGQSMSEEFAQQFGQPPDEEGDPEGNSQPNVGLGSEEEGQDPGDGTGARNAKGGRSPTVRPITSA